MKRKVQDSIDMSAILKRNLYHRNRVLLCICCGLLLFLGLLILYFLYPSEIFHAVGCLFPDERYVISVQINEKNYALPLFFKKHAHENSKGMTVPALLLCNIPVGGKKEHLKIFPDCIGIFQDPADWFAIKYKSLMIREGACLTIPLENDVKGWNTEYHIVHKAGIYYFLIFPGPQNKERILFSIHERLVDKVPLFYAGKTLAHLSEQQIFRPEAAAHQ